MKRKKADAYDQKAEEARKRGRSDAEKTARGPDGKDSEDDDDDAGSASHGGDDDKSDSGSEDDELELTLIAKLLPLGSQWRSFEKGHRYEEPTKPYQWTFNTERLQKLVTDLKIFVSLEASVNHRKQNFGKATHKKLSNDCIPALDFPSDMIDVAGKLRDGLRTLRDKGSLNLI